MAGFAAYAFAFAAWAAGLLGAPPSTLATDVAVLPVAAVAPVLAWRAARHPALTPRTRRAWVLLAIGTSCWSVGDAVWLVYEVIVGADMAATPADVFYLLFYPFVLGGLLYFPAPFATRTQRLTYSLDALTVLITGTMVSWCFIFFPLLASVPDSKAALFVAAAYPVGDLLLLFGIAGIVLRRGEAGQGPVYPILATGLLCNLLADWRYSYLTLTPEGYVSGQWPDALWVLTHFMIGLAAWLHTRRMDAGEGRAARALPAVREFHFLPYVAVAAGYSLLWVMWERAGTESLLGGLLVGAGTLTATVVARQALAVRENAVLLRAQVEAEHALRASEARFRSLVQSSSDVVTIVDVDTRIRYQSPAVTRVFGYPADALTGTRLLSLVHVEDLPRVTAYLAEAAAPGFVGAVECRVRHRDGSWRAADAVVTNLLADPAVQGIVLNTRDVTERRALEAQLAHQAFHDPLTGLANRVLFRDRVEHALARVARTRESLAVLFLDLDDFKHVNDSMGHTAGDQLLQAVAARLEASVRLADTVARLGGDEFAVLVEEVAGREGAEMVAARVLDSLADPIVLGSTEVFVRASVGLALRGGDETATELLRNADVAMYLVKSNGKGHVAVYEAAMHAMALERLELEADLRRALERGEFELHFQPIVTMRTRRIAGFEALVRWRHPARGLVMPGRFIPLAEETGLIIPIGRWVLREACRHLAGWMGDAGPEAWPLGVTVNLSARQLQDADLAAEVSAVLAETGLDPSALMLEITETVSLQDQTLTQRRLQELRELGVRLAIDDFGTGYSSLSCLKTFPLDFLKIDKSFVDLEGAAERDGAILETIISLGGSLDLRIVAEGIETPAQESAIRALGCEFAQGFLFARPMPPAAAEALLRADLPL
jgi:diguanylate cyclase (GGDEF)-like protein/PAS domain S-box-containing protein